MKRVVALGDTEWIRMAHLSFRKPGFLHVFERENESVVLSSSTPRQSLNRRPESV